MIGYIGSFVQYEGLENLVEVRALLKEKDLNFDFARRNENVSAPGSKGPITDEIRRLITENDLRILQLWVGFPMSLFQLTTR